MAVSDDALHQNEGSRAARPEPLPFLLFMCPVATTSATHQAHNFSSLLPHIDLTTASSKEPMNPYCDVLCCVTCHSGTKTDIGGEVGALLRGANKRSRTTPFRYRL